ncbi:hypothetical protein V5799_005677 [Amblyomma americanum]|uniref:Uncharacterized protein n=1 Tax=Amblyomma americanum TaxID=6943 RepID=A0AAQ4DYK1_AMBAM
MRHEVELLTCVSDEGRARTLGASKFSSCVLRRWLHALFREQVPLIRPRSLLRCLVSQVSRPASLGSSDVLLRSTGLWSFCILPRTD